MEVAKGRVGGYRVIRPLATGEYGSVILVSAIVKGEQDQTLRPLVLKIIRVDPRDPPTSEYAVLRAFRLGLVPHTIHAVGRARLAKLPPDLAAVIRHKTAYQQGHVYNVIAMQYVPGPTLREHLQSRATLGLASCDEWKACTRQLSAFAYRAYEVFRVGHGDLKLGNIIVERPSEFTVVDLSFGRRYAPGEPSAAWQRGTTCFMAPERLFYVNQPSWIGQDAATASDLWSIGVIMATVALTGLRISGMDYGQQLAVLDDSQRFNPGFTDTVYNLLCTRTMPWFHSLVSVITTDSNLPEAFVAQALRLILWTRALDKECAPLYQEADQYACFRESARFTAVSFYLDHVYSDYDTYGKGIFEAVISTLRSELGTYFMPYLLTQRWDPRARAKADVFSMRESDNPFEWMYAVFTGGGGDAKDETLSRVSWIDTLGDDLGGGEKDDDGLHTLFTGLSLNFCCLCGAATSPQLLRRRTHHGERICRVCALAKT